MKHYFSWLTNKVEKTKFLNEFGLRVVKKITKGERVIVFGGYVMSKKQFDSLSTKMKNYPFQIDDDLFFGLYKEEEVEDSDFLNHSCDPTCGFGGEITVVAMRDLKPGDEITIDYAMCLTSTKVAKINCLCGSKNCRKIISSNDWKIKKIQKHYAGYFEPYIDRKIKNLNK